MVKMYYDQDADLGILQGKKIAVIGYGSQGHAQAQNLRDSGIEVIVSELPGTDNYEKAKENGFEPMLAEDAASAADIIHILVPDEVQAALYLSCVEPEMKAGKALAFSHGFNVHFGQIVPPPEVNVYMVAPKGPGHLVRDIFVEGHGVPCLIAVYQEADGKARDLALAHAKGIGGTRAGVIETTFAEETETDLFGEQAVLCGGCTELVRAGFETLVEAGYQPEIAYFECLHELKLITDLMNRGGIAAMRDSISNTAEYGDLTRGKKIVTAETRAAMKKILADIQSGEFAREWILENRAGRPVFNALARLQRDHLIERVGAKLRSMMSWLK